MNPSFVDHLVTLGAWDFLLCTAEEQPIRGTCSSRRTGNEEKEKSKSTEFLLSMTRIT